MTYVEAPSSLWLTSEGRTLFLAGGITGCPDWQQEMMRLLEGAPVTLLNPRRKNFPIDDPNAAPRQIEWEHRMLRAATAVLFWFPKETICPIVLYELGAWSMTGKPIFVGVEPEYQRALDVEIQTALARPHVPIVHSLKGLAALVRTWAAGPRSEPAQPDSGE